MASAPKVLLYSGSPADRNLLLPVVPELQKYEITPIWGYSWEGLSHPKVHSIKTGEFKSPSVGISEAASSLTGASLADFEVRLVLVAGDRWESAYTALRAHLDHLPVAHLAAGDRSHPVFVDDAFRDVISSVASLSFCSHQEHSQRLIEAGLGGDVYTTGLPTLDVFKKLPAIHRDQLTGPLKDLSGDYILILLHPEPWGVDSLGMAREIVRTARNLYPNTQLLWLKPNSDPKGQELHNYLTKNNHLVFEHASPEVYGHLCRQARFVLGNSSSIVIDMPALKVPVILAGDRQAGRLRTPETLVWKDNDLSHLMMEAEALKGHLPESHLYGDGFAASRIASHIDDFLKQKQGTQDVTTN